MAINGTIDFTKYPVVIKFADFTFYTLFFSRKREKGIGSNDSNLTLEVKRVGKGQLETMGLSAYKN